MLDYPLLEALAAVDREGSFERAARALHVTASAISQRVKLLEERIGTVLLVRGTPCVATPAGRTLCRHVEQVGLLEHALQRELPALSAGQRSTSRPTLRIAVNADSLGTWFVDALAAFATGNDALVDVRIDDQDHTADWLRSGDVLAAVSADATPAPGCRVTPLGGLRYVATASPAFLQRHFAGGVGAAALAAAPVLRFNAKDTLQQRWTREVGGAAAAAPPTHWLPATQAFVDACVAGIGWGINPHALVADLLNAGRLVELVPGRDIVVPLYWQSTRLALPALERLGAAVVAAGRAALA